MKTRYDMSELNWTLSGWSPHLWRMEQSMEIGASPNAEISGVKACVPGSVQKSLLDAGLLPDWNVGLNYRECEWVENRHWIYEAVIPNEWVESGKNVRLNCRGLDYSGWVMVNGQMAAEFVGSHTPYVVDITQYLADAGNNTVRIAFDLPPRWLGQFGYTSQMTEWKPRFNYTWDWVVRLVQIGITAPVYVEVTDGREVESFRCVADADLSDETGTLEMKGRVSEEEGDTVRLTLERDGAVVRGEDVPAWRFNSGEVSWQGLPVELWWTNMEGDQPLYTVRCALLDKDGNELDSATRRVGFRHIDWAQCEGAPEGADPWLCVINGKAIFLQGANWVPLLPNFADVTEGMYRKHTELYKELGCNILRIWGGNTLERECFFDQCDELGILVWQEFPLSSSGIDNWPPEDEESIEAQAKIAQSYIERRQHHASLLLWCGGNELQGMHDGQKTGGGKPCDLSHPLLKRFAEIVEREDPTRRFLATSSSGPEFYAQPENYGKGRHWDTHGPWKAAGDLDVEWTKYWADDDSLMRSETGAPGASSVEMIERFSGGMDLLPIAAENPIWRRTSIWWLEDGEFVREMGRKPETLAEYVEWSQARQAKALTIAVGTSKRRFPRCGGIMLWMGHDCFPCNTNTAVIDFDCKPKPAALALKEIWRGPAGS